MNHIFPPVFNLHLLHILIIFVLTAKTVVAIIILLQGPIIVTHCPHHFCQFYNLFSSTQSVKLVPRYRNRTSHQTSLISLQLNLIVGPINCKLVMVRDYLFLMSVILLFALPLQILNYLMCFMFPKLPSHCFLFKISLLTIIVCLNFILLNFLWRIGSLREHFFFGASKDGLYSLSPSSSSPSAFLAERASPNCWHRRLEHPHSRVLRQIFHQNKLPCTSTGLHHMCTACQLKHLITLILASLFFLKKKTLIHRSYDHPHPV